ncbi:5'-nucleotidase [Aliarcobacter cryaerophilus]|nr:5'-nucleotidase [Aliarcobacter cryaerophilus]MCT7506519.1 5'-nucleotidase [Aliarcobacter cryaerophilus]
MIILSKNNAATSLRITNAINDLKLERPLNISCQVNSDRRNPITPELKF